MSSFDRETVRACIHIGIFCDLSALLRFPDNPDTVRVCGCVTV